MQCDDNSSLMLPQWVGMVGVALEPCVAATIMRDWDNLCQPAVLLQQVVIVAYVT